VGRKPSRARSAALDAYFVTVCDHGMNASTFTTRVVASTQADLFAAVTAGYCALTGPLHGGAPEPVLEMLDAIGSSERIKPWVDSALARGERLMGFGHRVYRVRDPRADVLKGAIERLAGGGADLAVRRRGRGLYPQRAAAEKSGPAARHQCGVLHRDPARRAENPAAGFTPIFAVARAAGWTAHAREQQRGGRLIRPSSAYIGPMPMRRSVEQLAAKQEQLAQNVGTLQAVQQDIREKVSAPPQQAAASPQPKPSQPKAPSSAALSSSASVPPPRPSRSPMRLLDSPAPSEQ
jgi:citrate synthase